jgi:hypothetical protein
MAKTSSKAFRYDKDGVHVVGVVNVANAGTEREAGGGETRVSRRQRVRVVQRAGVSVVSEHVQASEGSRPRTETPK